MARCKIQKMTPGRTTTTTSFEPQGGGGRTAGCPHSPGSCQPADPRCCQQTSTAPTACLPAARDFGTVTFLMYTSALTVLHSSTTARNAHTQLREGSTPQPFASPARPMQHTNHCKALAQAQAQGAGPLPTPVVRRFTLGGTPRTGPSSAPRRGRPAACGPPPLC